MKPATLIRVSFANIWRRKMRTILTVWGMSVGIGAMVLLISFAAGLQKQTEKSFLQAVSLTQLTVMPEKSAAAPFGASTSDKTFTPEDLETIRKIEHIRTAFSAVSVPPVEIVHGEAKATAFFQTTVVETLTDAKRATVSSGSWWETNDQASVVLTEDTLDQLKITPADAVGTTVTVHAVNFGPGGTQALKDHEAAIAGVMKKQGAMFFAADEMARDLAQTLSDEYAAVADTGTKPGAISSIEAVVDSAENVDVVKQAVADLGWYASGVDEILTEINKQFFIMKIVLGVIGGIALFVALIGITNSMLMAVLERTREIGILVALGASRRTVSILFLAEAGWLGFFGAALGLLGAYGIGKAIVAGISAYFAVTQKDTGELSVIQFSIDWQLVVGTLVGAVLITLLAGWLPARRAARQDPIAALRHE